MSSNGDENSLPSLPPDSPGSSVSAHMQEEYDELLRNAVIMPSYDSRTPPQTLADLMRPYQDKPRLHVLQTSNTGTPDANMPEERNLEDSSDTLVEETSREYKDYGESQSYSLPVQRLPVQSLPVQSLPVQSLPVQGLPVQSLPVQRLPELRQSPIMRDIVPDLTEDDESAPSARSEKSATRSGNLSGTSAGLNATKEKINVSEHHYVRPAFLAPSSGSVSLRSEESEGEVRHILLSSTTIDPDVGKMENLLDQWCLDLKRNVLAEYGQSKIRIVELGRLELMKEKERHTSEVNNLQNEIENLKELLHTYEKSVDRKDQVISNLTRALQKNKDKLDMMRKFNDWKICHNDRKREDFASNLARCHYNRKLSQKTWAGWQSVIETKWKTRVEKACQAKAQEVCLNLTNEYEAKIASLTEALESARQEVSRLHKERDRYEETMKKAFMRGVCALNMEAMSIFHGAEENGAGAAETGPPGEDHPGNFEGSLPEKDYSAPKTIPQEAVYREAPQQSRPAPRVVGAASHQNTGKATSTQSQTRQQSTKTVGKTKTVSTRITSKINSGRSQYGSGPDLPTLAPPMSTVMVERHQPVVKQTVGHATASKYPVKKDTLSGSSTNRPNPVVHKKIAGQSGGVTPHVQAVKIVE